MNAVRWKYIARSSHFVFTLGPWSEEVYRTSWKIYEISQKIYNISDNTYIMTPLLVPLIIWLHIKQICINHTAEKFCSCNKTASGCNIFLQEGWCGKNYCPKILSQTWKDEISQFMLRTYIQTYTCKHLIYTYKMCLQEWINTIVALALCFFFV